LRNSFLIQSDGAPGDILVKLVSETSSRTGEVEFLAKDQLDQDNVGTQPWSTEDGTQSTLLFFNNSATPQTFQVHFSGGGVAWHKNYTLQPMETEGIDIGELIASKTPDDSGKVLPLDTTSGVAIWIMAHHGAGKGRVLQSNATTGMARSFSCNEFGTVGGAEWQSNASSVPDGQTINVGGVVAAIVLVVGDGCTGTFEDYGNGEGYLFSYSSSNTSVATVTDPTGEDADVEGMSDGSATISGTVEDPEYGCEGFAEGNESVVPSISQSQPLWYFGSGINPSGFALGGTSATLTVADTTSGSYQWTVAAGTSKLSFQNGTASEETTTTTNSITILSESFSTGLNDVTVQVVFTPTEGSPITVPSYSLSIDSPYKLVSNGPTMNQGENAHCSGAGSVGYASFVPYKVLSFFGVAIPGIGINETFGTTVNLVTNNWGNPVPQGDNTTSGGLFSDFLCAAGGSHRSPLFLLLCYRPDRFNRSRKRGSSVRQQAVPESKFRPTQLFTSSTMQFTAAR
jgi:hypothetical protein